MGEAREKWAGRRFSITDPYALEAERKMGHMLRDTKRAKGGQPHEKAKKATSNHTSEAEPTLKELGTAFRESADAQLLNELSDEDFEKIKAAKKTKAKAKKELKARKKRKQIVAAAASLFGAKERSLSEACHLPHCSRAESFSSPGSVTADGKQESAIKPTSRFHLLTAL